MTNVSFGMGRVLRRSLSVWWRNLVPGAALSGIVHLPVIVLMLAGLGLLSREPLGTASAAFSAVTMMFGLVAQAVLTHSASQLLWGRRASVSESLGAIGQRLAPVLAFGFMLGLAYFLAGILPLSVRIAGTLVLAFVTLVFCVVIPVVMLESLGIREALERSRFLTRSYRLRIFGIWCVLGVVNLLVAWIARSGVAALEVRFALQTVAGFLFGVPLFVASNLAIYDELRTVKEGVEMESMRDFPHAHAIRPSRRAGARDASADPEHRA